MTIKTNQQYSEALKESAKESMKSARAALKSAGVQNDEADLLIRTMTEKRNRNGHFLRKRLAPRAA